MFPCNSNTLKCHVVFARKKKLLTNFGCPFLFRTPPFPPVHAADLRRKTILPHSQDAGAGEKPEIELLPATEDIGSEISIDEGEGRGVSNRHGRGYDEGDYGAREGDSVERSSSGRRTMNI